MTEVPKLTAQGWTLLIALSVLWGGSFFFVEIAVRELPVFTVVVARVGLAALILHGLLWLRGAALPRSREVWAAFFGMGLLNNAIPFTLIVWGQTGIASALAAILNATTPLFTVLIAHALTGDEKLTPARGLGVLLGFAGVVVMLGGDLLSGALAGSLAAQIAVLGGAFSYALAGVYGKRFKRLGVRPVATAAGQVTASSAMLIPLMLILERPWALPMPGWESLAALVGLAAFSTALAYILYFRLLEVAGATNLLLVTFLIPVSALILGIGLLGEVLALTQVAGMGLILLGLLAIDGRMLTALRPRLG